MAEPKDDMPFNIGGSREEFERRMTDSGIFIAGDDVLFDGEAAQHGYAPLTNIPWFDPDADEEDEGEQQDEGGTPQDIIDALGFDPLALADAAPDPRYRMVDGKWTFAPDPDADDLPPPHTSSVRVDAATWGADPDAPELGPVMRAAGIIFLSRSAEGDRVLFVKHAERGTWELPGGGIEEGETAEQAAIREVGEEIGQTPHGQISLVLRQTIGGVDYSTFIAHVSELFEPVLADGELTDWQWCAPSAPPDPLHPGVRLVLGRLSMNELDLARAIASGEYASPQQYENLWLFAMRITGTGSSYRDELNEFVWRDPAIYLNSDFLARCVGLPVIYEHPATSELTQAEWEKRVVGSIMLAFIEEDEVWGIGRIYDQDIAQLMRDKQMSTSPAVIFRNPAVNQTRRLASGRTLLIEGEPSLLDHLAICELGVWDKGGDPTGVDRGVE